jgi:hypothetical protein
MTRAITAVSHEQAIQISSEMNTPYIHETPSLKVVSGYHEDYGAIHVVIPAMGGYVLLPAQVPFATQSQTA